MLPVIKLMAEYSAWPLWWAYNDHVGDIDPYTLPIAPETVTRLLSWEAKYEAHLNWNDPASSKWPSREAYEEFEREGFHLWLKLREELKDTYQVLYHSELLQHVITEPGEWPGI